MSLHLEFEPHSWYMGWATKDNRESGHDNSNLERPLEGHAWKWSAYTDNGMTGYIEETHADTLKQLKQQIKQRTLAERERVARLYE